MAIQFDYPQNGWSTGKMRKRGQKVAGDFPEVSISPEQSRDLNARLRAKELMKQPPTLPMGTEEFLRQRQIDRLAPRRGTLLGGDQKVAMDYQKRGEPQSALAEMEKAAGFGLAARGGAIPAVPGVQGVPIAEHKAQIQDAVTQVASGDMTTGAFKKMLKKLGWSGDHETGQFTDPTGQQHQIGGNGANGTRISQ